jgi:hypothetical protein
LLGARCEDLLDSWVVLGSKVSMKTSIPPSRPDELSTEQSSDRQWPVKCSGEFDLPGARDASFAREYSARALGDSRLSARAVAFANSAVQKAECTLPTMAGGEGRAAGLYRYLANGNVTAPKLMQQHVEETCKRARQSSRTVLAVHDTTTMGYGIHTCRSGLGPIAGGGRGFLAHFSLAVEEESRKPLGVLACSTWVRPTDDAKPVKEGTISGENGAAASAPEPSVSVAQADTKAIADKGPLPRYSRTRPKSDKRKKSRRQDDPENEAIRWTKQALEVRKLLQGLDIIHVIDREGDSFAIIVGLLLAGALFVIRSKDDRVLADGKRLFAQLDNLVCKATRTVHINARAPAPSAKQRKTNPPREEREAELHMSGGTFNIPRTSHAARSLPKSVKLNYVNVWEPNPPAGCEPISWRLMTQLPVDTPEQLLRVVDIYRVRWVIEDFNKAVKTGCSFVDHQLESYAALCKLLALLLPVAWRLLLLRHTADDEPYSPAEVILSKVEITILRAVHDREHPKSLLPQQPTVRDAMWAIACQAPHHRDHSAPQLGTTLAGVRGRAQREQAPGVR